MRRYLFGLLFGLLLGSNCFAAAPVNEGIKGAEGTNQSTIGPDVPELAAWEASRRGNMVQDVGTIQASEDDLIADALAHPADDSYKWYCTLVKMEGCAACARLEKDIATNPILRAWIDVDDVVKSVMHYQVRRIEDQTQQDWFKQIKGEINRGGFPAIVIQPPRNGKYGKNSTTVAILHGYNGDAENLTVRMRRAITTYVDSLNKKGLLANVIGDNAQRISGNVIGGFSGGHKQEQTQAQGTIAQGGVGVAPPFSIIPNNIPPQTDFPPVVNVQPLTVDQIKALVPTAPPEFQLAVIQAKLTDASQVMLQWQVYQSQHPSNPTLPVNNTDLLAGLLDIFHAFTQLGMMGGIIAIVAFLLRNQSKLREIFTHVQEALAKSKEAAAKSDETLGKMKAWENASLAAGQQQSR